MRGTTGTAENNMWEYIYKDLVYALRYLPFGFTFGIPAGIVFSCVVNGIRGLRSKEPAPMLPSVLFGIYAAVMLMITFLSRESGSRKGIDLELFSTWGNNDRNHSFVVENVLLFIPYGFLSRWAFGWTKRFWGCMFLGAVTSLGIETLQLVTQRGYFQIDDILTNILGTFIGFLLFAPFVRRRK